MWDKKGYQLQRFFGEDFADNHYTYCMSCNAPVRSLIGNDNNDAGEQMERIYENLCPDCFLRRGQAALLKNEPRDYFTARTECFYCRRKVKIFGNWCIRCRNKNWELLARKLLAVLRRGDDLDHQNMLILEAVNYWCIPERMKEQIKKLWLKKQKAK